MLRAIGLACKHGPYIAFWYPHVAVCKHHVDQVLDNLLGLVCYKCCTALPGLVCLTGFNSLVASVQALGQQQDGRIQPPESQPVPAGKNSTQTAPASEALTNGGSQKRRRGETGTSRFGEDGSARPVRQKG